MFPSCVVALIKVASLAMMFSFSFYNDFNFSPFFFCPSQDPESIDDFQDSNQKLSGSSKENNGSSYDPSVTFPRLAKLKPFSVSKGEPSFISFLMGGDRDSSSSSPGNRRLLPLESRP